MTDQSARTFGSDFRQFFFRGLVVLLPSVLTLWIVVKAYQFVDNTIAQPINRGVRIALVNVADHSEVVSGWEPLRPTEDELIAVRRDLAESGVKNPSDARIISEARQRRIAAWWQDKWYMNLIGLFVAAVSVYLAGRFLGGFLGRRMYRRIETMITSLPVFKQIYPYVKQIVDFLFSDDQPIKFNRVVAVEYPRKGIWSVGFMTGATMRSVAERAGDSVTVFIPSSPTPFTGYTITVNKADVVEIPISVDEAIRFAVSGGVLVPDHQTIPTDSRAFTAASRDVGLIPIPGDAADVDPPIDGDENTKETAGRRDAG